MQGYLGGVAAAQFRGVNVNLDDGSAGQGDAPVEGDLAAGVAADKEGEVGFGDDFVGAPAGIGAADAHGEGVIFGDGALGVQGGGYGDVEHFSQLDYFGLGSGGGDAAAGDDDGTAGGGQCLGGFADFVGAGFGAEGGAVAEVVFDDDFEVGFAVFDDFALDAHKVEVDGAGSAGGGFAESLAQEVGELFYIVHGHAVFGGGAEGAEVFDFLVGVAVLVGEGTVAGDGDDRGEAEEGVLQAGGEVGGADGLGHTDGGAVGGAGVAVGHVGGGFFAVGDDALDANHFQFSQDAAGDGGDIKDMGEAVAFEGFGYEAGAGH